MGIAAAAVQMKAFNQELKRAREQQEKILSNAKKLDSIQGSGGIAGQQALQGGQLVGAGATALPGDPGGLKALLKSVFRVIGVGGAAVTASTSGGGTGVNATASSSRSAAGIRGPSGPRFNTDEIVPSGQQAPFFAGFNVNVRQLQATLDLIKALRERNQATASTRSSR